MDNGPKKHRPINPDRPGYVWNPRVGWVPIELEAQWRKHAQKKEWRFRLAMGIIGLIALAIALIMFATMMWHIHTGHF